MCLRSGELLVEVALAFVSRVSAGVRLQVLQTALVALPESG